MFDVIRREVIYLWYYFSLQLEQIIGYWVLGMVLGSIILTALNPETGGIPWNTLKRLAWEVGSINLSVLTKINSENLHWMTVILSMTESPMFAVDDVTIFPQKRGGVRPAFTIPCQSKNIENHFKL